MGFFLEKFDAVLKKLFFKLGYKIAQNTGYFIIVPILLTAMCATGFQQIIMEDDPEYLLAPTHGHAKYERAVIEENFIVNFTHDFNPGRITRNGRFVRFLLVAKDRDTLLREEVWEDIMTVDRKLREVEIHEEESTFSYKDLCAIWAGKCHGNPVLDVGELIPAIRNHSFNLTYPFMLNPNTFESYVFPFYFGGIETTNYSTIVSVEAVSLFYWLKSGSTRDDGLAHEWEKKVTETFLALELEHIKITFLTSRTLESELKHNAVSLSPYFGLAIIIMFTFCLVTVSAGDSVRSKTLMGVIGIVCAGLSCMAAFGLLMYAGVPFIAMNFVVPFLMLGIGIDDTFVMLAAWRRSNLQDPVPTRLANSFADAAVSITITSLTDMISFFIGVVTPFPAVQFFSIYTGTAVLLTYLWHITLFGACLAVSGYAEQKQRHNILCIPVKAYSESKDESCCYRLCCSGGISQDDPYNPKDNRRHAIMVFFRDYVATFLNIPAIKGLVVFWFLVYLAIAVYGCTQVQEGLERRKLARYDSYIGDFFDLEDQYFRVFPYRVQMAITGDYNYSDSKTQDKIIGFLEKIESYEKIGDPLFTESWLRQWRAFMGKNGVWLGLNNTDELTLIANLKEYFLGGEGNSYAYDVILNEEETRITASRFIVQAYNFTDPIEERNLVVDLRRYAEESELNVTFYHPLFIYFDQFTLVRSTTIQAVSLAAAVMMIVSLIFIPNPLCSLWVAFSIVSIEVGVVGYMSLWGVNLDSISMVQLIMCIGFSVDFSAHISYAYLSAKVDTPDERVRECLYGLGLPIVQGAVSTILGIMVLVLAPSYLFITFFKTVFLVIFFGAVHGLFLLPVLLSLFGPGSCSKEKKTESDAQYFMKNITNGGSPVPIREQLSMCGLDNCSEKHLRSFTPLGRDSKVIVTAPAASKSHLFSSPSADCSASNEDCGSLELDQGLGTSGEESSESSHVQKDTRKTYGISQAVDNSRRRDPGQEAYSNVGFLSDDVEAEERRARERRSQYYGIWDNYQPPNRITRWQSARYAPKEPRY